MASITVSPAARKDLLSIQAYSRDELNNPDAAQRILAALKKCILSLQAFPERGRPLDALIRVHTPYRYLTCENYCVFYLSNAENLLIIRILHQKQDCLRALFLED